MRYGVQISRVLLNNSCAGSGIAATASAAVDPSMCGSLRRTAELGTTPRMRPRRIHSTFGKVGEWLYHGSVRFRCERTDFESHHPLSCLGCCCRSLQDCCIARVRSVPHADRHTETTSKCHLRRMPYKCFHLASLRCTMTTLCSSRYDR